MESAAFNEGLLQFIAASPTPFHATRNLFNLLTGAGFIPLDEAGRWELKPGQAYVVTRNDSSLIAFRVGRSGTAADGVRLAGAHTDSPCLKLKPNPDLRRNGYLQLGVEVYGGALLNPWFDRDLSIAGKLSYVDADGGLHTRLVDVGRPVAVIPSLAIHLDREVNQQRSINAQQHLPAILLQGGEDQSLEQLLLEHLQQTEECRDARRILSHELSLYDTQPPALVGWHQQFIAAARLDNLLSCYLACRSLLDCDGEHFSLLVCNDHEEVGSTSASGAQGPFLKSVLQRLLAAGKQDSDSVARLSQQSLMLSIDNAHGVHPNFADKHDPAHSPLLNGGPVIKINANQRYASNSDGVARFRQICERLNVKTQAFVMRSDLACGSTIGPLTAAQTGINTVDIGVATFAMHSIRELAGADDAANLSRVVCAFFNRL
ncbi:MAG: hypothetical protein RLZZ385_1126 [Pseudomonadota bacterium]|jgi:aspartyl aminopeptidase